MKMIEKYRPSDLGDVCGQDRAVETIRGIIDAEGWGGQAWYITGPTGTGKTTIARILAGMGAPACGTWEMNAGAVGVETVRQIAERAETLSLFGGRCWIVNEAHLLSSRVVSEFLDCLEVISDGGRDCIIFTTTWAGSDSLFSDAFDSKPFAGRCNQVSLSNQGLKPAIVARLLEIAGKEGITLTEKDAEKIVKTTGNTFREAIQELAKLARSCRLSAVA